MIPLDARSASSRSDPDLVDLAWHGISLCRMDNWDDGLLYLEFAARIDAGDRALPSLAYSYLGYGLASRQGRYQDGIGFCEEALAIEPSEPENYLNLARTYLLSDQRKYAVQTLDRALLLDTDHEGVLRLREKLGWRRRQPIRWLARDQFVNRILGKMRRGNADQQERQQLAIELQRSRELQHTLGTRDPVSGLCSRAFLQRNLHLALARAERTNRQIALLFFDIDGFKAIKETGGHDLGDRLLRSVGDRLAETAREVDLLARVGNDEFAVLLQDVADDAHVAGLVERILERLEMPFRVEDRDFWITVSAGIAVGPRDGRHPEVLLGHAEAAMGAGEARSRGNCRFYSEALRRRTGHKQSLERRLREAVQDGSLSVHFQPIHHTRTLEVVGAEALLRWDDPSMGPVEPEQFIPIAEETGLIVPIGEWVLRTACQHWRSWQDVGLVSSPLSVNVSAHQLRYPARVGRIAEIVRRSGLHASLVRLEITERSIVQDDPVSLAALERLRAMGVRLSLDDFGTGNSSLTLLRRLPVDCVKIGQSYIKELRNARGGVTLAAAIIAMAHRLNLTVVAEGVETSEQRRYLLEQGCDQIQGHLLGEAQPPERLVRYLEQKRFLTDHETSSS